jgi:hypothetical protein
MRLRSNLLRLPEQSLAAGENQQSACGSAVCPTVWAAILVEVAMAASASASFLEGSRLSAHPFANG